MSIELNHTIVHARDAHASATFLAHVLGVEAAPQWGPFVPVQVGQVTFDYMNHPDDFTPQHYAFLVGEDDFDAAFGRIQADAIPIWADPHQEMPGEINHHDGGRGVYFQDPDGHLLELITRPYGAGAQ